MCRGHARPFWEGLWGTRFLVLLGLRTSLDAGGFDGPATIPLPYVDRLACAWWAREWVAGAHACGEPCLWRSCCLAAACGCVRRCCGWLGSGHALCMCDVTSTARSLLRGAGCKPDAGRLGCMEHAGLLATRCAEVCWLCAPLCAVSAVCLSGSMLWAPTRCSG